MGRKTGWTLVLVAAATCCGGKAIHSGETEGAGASAGNGETAGLAGVGPVPTTDNAGAPSGGTATESGIPLTPIDGWVDGASNVLGIQGQFYTDADTTTALSLVRDFNGAQACIRGTAARVEQASIVCATMMFTPPATDCFGQYRGVALQLDLNQAAPPAVSGAYDASAIQGFSFELNGPTVPDSRSLRFFVSDKEQQFCTPFVKKLMPGVNTVLFRELLAQCSRVSTMPPNPTAETAQARLLTIGWQVTTNTSGTVPFDFCVSNLRAIP